jgi:hypothetical protein
MGMGRKEHERCFSAWIDKPDRYGANSRGNRRNHKRTKRLGKSNDRRLDNAASHYLKTATF